MKSEAALTYALVSLPYETHAMGVPEGHKGLPINCPFHKEETPSCLLLGDAGDSIYGGEWHCFGCNSAGSFHWLEKNGNDQIYALLKKHEVILGVLSGVSPKFKEGDVQMLGSGLIALKSPRQ
jgi:hypothetical protein